MSNIIKEIEAEQLKATVDQFEVGDTVKDLAFTFSQRREDRSCKKR